MVVAAALIAVTVLAVVLLRVTASRLEKDGTWHEHGDQMRRWAGGKWQYRPMTAEEYTTQQCDAAW